MRYENNNLSFIQQNLRYLGFGEAIPFNDQLVEELKKDNREFQLKTEVHFDEWSKLEATLFFRRTGQQDSLFLIKYTSELQYPDNSDLNRMQTFYIFKGAGVTLKESYNLLQERAVYKELTGDDGEKYYAWLQLDFSAKTTMNNYKTRQFRKSHGYDLEKTLSMYPIRELKDYDLKANLVRSLQKGNFHPVTIEKGNKVDKVFIAANPQFKTITICSEAAVEARHLKLNRSKDEREGTAEL